MPSRRPKASLLFFCVAFSVGSVAALSGCAAEAEAEDGAPTPTGTAEEALTALPSGRYAIAHTPLSGSYISRMTLAPGKKVELEYVRRTTRSEPLFGNPWFPVPVTKETALVARGTYRSFDCDRGTCLSFDLDDAGIDRLIYGVRVVGKNIHLEAIGQSAFELRPTTEPTPPTDARVLRCKSRMFDAVITLDEVQRRRGRMTVTRTSEAEATDPKNGTFTIVYSGDTGVDDWMAYEGVDDSGDTFELTMRRREVDRRSGEVDRIGLSHTRQWSSYGTHHTLSCTVGTR